MTRYCHFVLHDLRHFSVQPSMTDSILHLCKVLELAEIFNRRLEGYSVQHSCVGPGC